MADENQNLDGLTVFEMVGGEPAFKALVDDFYRRVEADPLLRPMFPDDLEPGKRWQYLFLMQYFGGPAQYVAERGHPRLRMRHNPFPIDINASERWAEHMHAAIDAVGIKEPSRSIMREYFQNGARFFVNRVNPNHADLE
jgi:hemoglobin